MNSLLFSRTSHSSLWLHAYATRAASRAWRGGWRESPPPGSQGTSTPRAGLAPSVGGNHLSDTTRLTQAFFKSDEYFVKV